MSQRSPQTLLHPATRLAALLLCLILGCLPAGAQPPLEAVTLQLKWKHAFQFAGYYAAIEQGYYADAGFDVTLQELVDARSPVDFLLSGEADYAVTGSEIVIHRANGATLVALATIFQHSAYGFLVREDSGIESVEDFVGKRVMLNGGIQDADLLSALRNAGLTDNDYQRQLTSFDAMSLVRGETDVFNAYVTDQLFLLQEQGLGGRYILPQLYGVDFYSDILVTTEANIAAAPARAEAFRDASLKGWNYALNHMDELIDLILEKYNTQNLSRAHLEYEANSSREMILPLVVRLGYMNPERWQHIHNVFIQEGVLSPQSRIDGLYYDETAEELRIGQWLAQHSTTVLITGVLLLLALLSAAILHAHRLVKIRTNELAENQRLGHQQHLQLQKLLDTINGISWEFDLAQGRFTYVSQNLKRLLGYSHAEMSTMDDWLNMIVDEDRDEALVCCMSETEAGRDHVFEYRMKKRNGDIISVLDVVRVLKGKDGKPTQLAGFMVDITERKQTERALRRAQRMDAVGQLTGGIAHDFNNILGIIQGNVDLMEQQLDHPALLQQSIGSLQVTTQRAIRLTQQLLGFSHARSEYAEAADLNTVIGEMRELTAGSLTPEIHVRHELADDLWYSNIDCGDFQNALLNLVLNARDAMPRGGELVIRTGNISVARATAVKTGLLQPGDYVLLSVADSGVGIPAEKLDRIFEPFFTTKDAGKSNGLGLPMVFGFVQRANGQIDVDTHEGSGTSVTLYLPRTMAEPEPREGSAVSATTNEIGQEHMLVERIRQCLDSAA
jgi:PAS domain S-box-containing protein